MSILAPFSASAYVFDKDGTLIDTESVWFVSDDRWLRSYGASHTIEEQRNMLGAAADACVRIFQERHAVLPQGEESVATLIQERQIFFQHTRAEMGVRLLPGVQDFINACLHKGVLLAMATNATRENTTAELDVLGWTHLFKVIITADDIDQPKPAPDIYLEAARQTGVDPSQCLAFEDATRGVQSAHAAGMKVVFVCDARFGVDVPPEADLTVGSFVELL